MAPLIKHLLALAPPSLFIIVIVLSVWSQSQSVAWYRDEIADGEALSMVNGTLTAVKNDTDTALLLHRSDSLYKYNISTAPIVIEKYKLLLFTIEKTGSTVLKQLMRRLMGYENYYYHGKGIPHVFPWNGLKILVDYSLPEANEMLTSDKWTRAMFVRDPKERILSGYLMWRPKKFPEETLRNAQKGLLNETLVNATLTKFNRGLIKCCRDRAKGDYNYEVLCLNHMLTFEGFLGMVENPNKIDDRNANDEGLEGHQPKNTTKWSPHNLHKSPSCPDKHWSPVTQWRMEKQFYPQLNFIGHLETAKYDIKRLLNIIHPNAWEMYGASGWGKHRNESMFESTSTVLHAKKTENYLSEHYTDQIEKRVEKINEDDYDNTFLDLERVPVGQAQSFYRKRFLQRFGSFE